MCVLLNVGRYKSCASAFSGSSKASQATSIMLAGRVAVIVHLAGTAVPMPCTLAMPARTVRVRLLLSPAGDR